MRSNSCRDYTVVIPVLNEAEALPLVLKELTENGVPRENVLIVDGHSVDGTRKVAESMGFKVILQEGTGKAMAIKTAVETVESDCYVFMDGDYTYPAKHIPELLEKLGQGRDLVIGSRVYVEKGLRASCSGWGTRLSQCSLKYYSVFE